MTTYTTFNAINRMLTQRNGKGERISVEAVNIKPKA